MTDSSQTNGFPPVLDIRRVVKRFRVPGSREWKVAVNDVSLTVGQRETVALVGESGSGKSTLAKIALRLVQPDQGDVEVMGTSVWKAPREDLRQVRLRVQPVFQDPVASFNPRRRIDSTMAQALRAKGMRGKEEILQRTRELLDHVGLRPSDTYLQRWPHQLSGGQRQRLAIARALAMEPALIIADEPLTGADVSIRGQILNLFRRLQDEDGVSYLFITHDIAIARALSQRVHVMRHGAVVDSGDTESVLGDPQHDYTRRLIAATPQI